MRTAPPIDSVMKNMKTKRALETPSAKHQAPDKLASFKHRIEPRVPSPLELPPTWGFSGIWRLALGALSGVCCFTGGVSISTTGRSRIGGVCTDSAQATKDATQENEMRLGVDGAAAREVAGEVPSRLRSFQLR
jgi:hypothetical protein